MKKFQIVDLIIRLLVYTVLVMEKQVLYEFKKLQEEHPHVEKTESLCEILRERIPRLEEDQLTQRVLEEAKKLLQIEYKENPELSTEELYSFIQSGARCVVKTCEAFEKSLYKDPPDTFLKSSTEQRRLFSVSLKKFHQLLVRENVEDPISPRQIVTKRKKKTYLNIHHDKVEREKTLGTGSTHAVCGDSSPKASLRKELALTPNWNYEEKEFFRKFMDSEMEQSKQPRPKLGKSARLARVNLEIKLERLAREGKYLPKIEPNENRPPQTELRPPGELLEKRRKYGMRMTMRNRFRIYESKVPKGTPDSSD